LRVEHAFTVAQRQGLATALAAGRQRPPVFAPALSRPVVYADDPASGALRGTYEAAQRRQPQRAARSLASCAASPRRHDRAFHAVARAATDGAGASDEYRRAARGGETRPYASFA
jgi:hypothetical protein